MRQCLLIKINIDSFVFIKKTHTHSNNYVTNFPMVNLGIIIGMFSVINIKLWSNKIVSESC